MANRIGELVVKRRSPPALRVTLVGVAVVGLVAAGLGLYRYGESVAGFNAEASARAAARSAKRIHRLKRQAAALAMRLTVSRHLLESDHAAYHGLVAALARADQRVMSLREKLGFYHAVLAAAHSAKGVRIESFHVVRSRKAWRYRLALVRPFAANGYTYASVRFTVHGQEGGRARVVSYPRPVAAPLTMHFKYFADARGPLPLPARFVPHSVVVSIAAAGRLIHKRYPWPAPPPAAHS